MRSFIQIVLTLLFLIVSLSSCSSIPGATGAEQSETIDALVERTLNDLGGVAGDTPAPAG